MTWNRTHSAWRIGSAATSGGQCLYTSSFSPYIRRNCILFIQLSERIATTTAFSTFSPRSTSFTDRIKNAISAFAPKEIFGSNLDAEEVITNNHNHKYIISNGINGPHTSLPSHLLELIKPINNTSDRLLVLIKTRQVPTRVLLTMYRPIAGSLRQNCIIDFAFLLYSDALYHECFSVIMDNLPFSDGLSFIANNLIPAIAKSELDTADFAIFIFFNLLSQSNQQGSASHLLHYLKESSLKTWINYDNLILESQLQLYLFSAQSKLSILQLLQKSTFVTRKDTIEEYLQDNDIHYVTRTTVLKALLKIGDRSMFKRTDIALLQIHGVLRNLCREISQYDPNDSYLAIVDLLQSSRMRFSRYDIMSISKLCTTKPRLNELFTSFLGYITRIYESGSDVRYKSSALLTFLSRAITLGNGPLAIGILNILNKRLTDEVVVGNICKLIMWKYSIDKSTNITAQNTFTQPNGLNHRLMKKVYSIVGPKLFESGIITSIKSLNSSSDVTGLLVASKKGIKLSKDYDTPVAPAHILWSLISSLCDIYKQKLPAKIEEGIALCIASRPIHEQFYYFSLPQVSNQGVITTMELYTDLQFTITSEPISVQYYISGLTLAQKKTLDKPCSASDYLDGTELIPLDSKNCVSIDFTPIQTIFKRLVLRQNYQTALRLSDFIINNRLYFSTNNGLLPLSLYYELLRSSAVHDPALCLQIYTWLRKTNNMPVSAVCIRYIIQGFLRSPHLTDRQSLKRVTGMCRILWARNMRLGPNLCIELVESLFERAKISGSGSSARINWAVRLAKRENVSDEYVRKWHHELQILREYGGPFWKPKER